MFLVNVLKNRQIFAYFWRRNLPNFKFDCIVLRKCYFHIFFLIWWWGVQFVLQYFKNPIGFLSIRDFTLANCWGTSWSKSDLTYRHPEIIKKYLPIRIWIWNFPPSVATAELLESKQNKKTRVLQRHEKKSWHYRILFSGCRCQYEVRFASSWYVVLLS